MQPTEELQQLLRPGVLGFYKSCEITIACLLDDAQNAHNLFMLCVFESRELVDAEPNFLTLKNEHFGSKKLNLAVFQYQTSIEEALAIHQQISEGRREIDTRLGSLHVCGLAPMPQAFVPMDSTVLIPLNRILKNNFRGGSALVEWLGATECLDALLPQGELRRATLRIRELLPIDLQGIIAIKLFCLGISAGQA